MRDMVENGGGYKDVTIRYKNKPAGVVKLIVQY